MSNDNMKLNTFKSFYNEGIWNKATVEYLKTVGVISEEEATFILKESRKAKKDPRVSDEKYTYEIWDKKSPVNGVSAEKVLKDSGLEHASEIFLVISPFTGRVLRIESQDTIKDNYHLQARMSVDNVAEYYLEKMEEMANAPQIDYEKVNAGMEIYSRALGLHQVEEIKELLVTNNDLLTKMVSLLEAR